MRPLFYLVAWVSLQLYQTPASSEKRCSPSSWEDAASRFWDFTWSLPLSWLTYLHLRGLLFGNLAGAICYPFCPFAPPLPFDWPSGVVGQRLGLSILVPLHTLGVSLLWIGSAADDDQIFVTSLLLSSFLGRLVTLGLLILGPSGERRFGRAPFSLPYGLSSCKAWVPGLSVVSSLPWNRLRPCTPVCRRLCKLCVAPGLSMLKYLFCLAAPH